MEESLVDKEQHLIEKNMMENLLHDSDNSDTIVLCPAAVNIYCIGEVKRDLRCNKWIIKLMTKTMEVAEVSTAYTIIYMLQRQSLMLMMKSYNMAFKQICRESIIYKRAMCSTDITFWQQIIKKKYNNLIKNKT